MKYSVVFFLCAMSSAAVYTGNNGSFHLQYDETKWEVVSLKAAAKPTQEVDQKMEENTLVTFQRKEAEREGTTRYFPRFSVVLDDTRKIKAVEQSKGSKTAAYQAHSVQFLKGQRFDILSTSDRKIQGSVTGFETVANQRDFGLTFDQVGFLDGDKAYLLTATARTKGFEAFESEFKSMFDSFQFQPSTKN